MNDKGKNLSLVFFFEKINIENVSSMIESIFQALFNDALFVLLQIKMLIGEIDSQKSQGNLKFLFK